MKKLKDPSQRNGVSTAITRVAGKAIDPAIDPDAMAHGVAAGQFVHGEGHLIAVDIDLQHAIYRLAGRGELVEGPEQPLREMRPEPGADDPGAE
jgi:hypothetical protein